MLLNKEVDSTYNELYHSGVFGMKWGVRRYQNLDGSLTPAGRERYGSLTPAGRERLERLDNKWARKNQKKITRAVQKSIDREMREYSKNELDPKYRRNKYTTRGKLNSYYVNEYNRKLASLMNERVGNIESPSGRVVRFVAKRGDVGVHMALADVGYDMNQLRNGVWSSGKIAYRNQSVEVSHWAIQNGSNEFYHSGILGMKWGVRRYQNLDGTLTPAGRERYNRDGSYLFDYANYGIRLRHQSKELDKRKANAKQKTLSELPRLEKKMTPEKSMRVINPGYPNEGSTNNCLFCTVAMAMREKGYDVVAQKSDHAWYRAVVIPKCFNTKTVQTKAHTGTELLRELNNYGDAAYGNLSVTWKAGGGHSVFWKNEGNRTRIYDGQNGLEWDVKNPETANLFKAIHIDETEYVRLDNCQPTDYILGIVEPR